MSFGPTAEYDPTLHPPDLPVLPDESGGIIALTPYDRLSAARDDSRFQVPETRAIAGLSVADLAGDPSPGRRSDRHRSTEGCPWHRGVLPARRRGAARGRSCARARANRLPRGLPRREGASAARLAVRHPKAPARTVPGAERRTGKPERCSVWELARGAPGPPTHEPTTGERRPVAASPKARGAPRSPKGSRTGAERRGARGPKEHGHAGERAFTPPKRRATDPDTGGFERGHPPSAPTMPRGSRSGEPAQGGGKAAARGAGPDSPVDHDALRWRSPRS